jgi:BON domain
MEALTRSRAARLGGGVVLGALVAFLLDPASGRRRRHLVRDRTLGLARRSGRRSRRLVRGVNATSFGLVQRVKHRRKPGKVYDDLTLRDKVETELFRAADSPKGRVVVSVVGGVVALRGEARDERELERLVKQTRDIDGVLGVESLLHLPGQPAPMHQ